MLFRSLGKQVVEVLPGGYELGWGDGLGAPGVPVAVELVVEIDQDGPAECLGGCGEAFEIGVFAADCDLCQWDRGRLPGDQCVCALS